MKGMQHMMLWCSMKKSDTVDQWMSSESYETTLIWQLPISLSQGSLKLLLARCIADIGSKEKRHRSCLRMRPTSVEFISSSNTANPVFVQN